MDNNERRLMVECDNLVKIYKTAESEVVALQGLDLEVEEGELMAIIGNSGSGKSTLLNMLGGLDRPSAGKLHINGEDILKYDDKQLREYMKSTVGFVWQNNARNLIPYLTVTQNIELPMILAGNTANKRERVLELLDAVAMTHRKKSKLNQLSGGEQQRVAIAIALANNPKLLLADEPTGSVDAKTTSMIMDVFNNLKDQFKVTIVIVTHDTQLAKSVDRVVAIRDGRTSSEFLIKKSYAQQLAEMGDQILEQAISGKIDTHEELVVVDKYGRLQLPKDTIETLRISGKTNLKVEMDGDRIILTVPSGEDLKNFNKKAAAQAN
jgi:ABC-type lipoprotein export system ATPase subunit